ncbi:aldehyde dehydrogenase (NADP(+)) [Methylobacterium sp. J-030]|uniref:aldehyde dehydrogenase (NADP(+)) n=1 Tax=Methylobacterium sp. J-030 TaxID=2836627 RepID=UPI001FBAD2E8|nr:aldehyde dehydrogenase (NADP(+)) [Methylobacterium sp. J-030]MCJ2071301.1 aldehyde dehydrogenase (NADP(+)) [Methylobacterium sp. J-030]
MTLRGENLIGAEARRGTEASVRAVEAATGEALDPDFPGASRADLDRACALAEAAFDAYRETDPETRAGFLETIADNILEIGDDLVTRCMAETGLPRPRIEGERARTAGQLRLFASVVRAGSAVEARIDPALPDRKPLPRPDLRLRRIAIGPVAVFGASNFPLAFSVAGGDTASALAAGCPVIVKAHPAHPGTSELVGRAVRKAVASCGLPEGVFSLLFDAGQSIGQTLVADPRIAAVGFTGSRRGGTALMTIAAGRPHPIPVYAEMSSINPVLLFPGALAARGAAIGKAFAASLTLGAGQFCTNPGLILAQPGPGLDAFLEAAGTALKESPAATMLTPGIGRAYREGVAQVAGHAAVTLLAEGSEGTATQGRAALFATEAGAFLANPALQEEMFGAAALVVRCPDQAAMRAVLEHLEGQLTASLHLAPEDHAAARDLLPLLERRVGRILVDGFGTGVEVAHAMVHGGPYPATSDGRSTSVGSLAIDRFLRPVSYQDVPDALLPPALQAANPLGLPRRIDGAPERR